MLKEDPIDTSDLPAWPLGDRPGFLARRLHQIHVALFTDMCGAFGVTPVQYSLLSALTTRGTADQTTLAADVALDRTTTTGALKRLETRGLIKRAVSDVDRRARACALTPEGVTLLREMEEAARNAHNTTIAALNIADQAIFMRLLRGIVDANSDRTATPTPLG
jgi:DNA-binding MarR family transcriptional regulator